MSKSIYEKALDIVAYEAKHYGNEDTKIVEEIEKIRELEK